MFFIYLVFYLFNSKNCKLYYNIPYYLPIKNIYIYLIDIKITYNYYKVFKIFNFKPYKSNFIIH